LQEIVAKPFARLSYTDAVELLQKAKKRFTFPVKWGSDLQSEHERYLTETEFKGTPLFITDYPKDIKVIHDSLTQPACHPPPHPHKPPPLPNETKLLACYA